MQRKVVGIGEKCDPPELHKFTLCTYCTSKTCAVRINLPFIMDQVTLSIKFENSSSELKLANLQSYRVEILYSDVKTNTSKEVKSKS